MEEDSRSDSERESKRSDTGASLRVRVQDSVFTADRALLADGCEYFRALFRSGMRESRQEEVELRSVQPRGFLIALAVLRGERPILNDDQILDAIECAAFLQVEPLSRHLADNINSDNCLLLCQAASFFGLQELYHSAALFVRDMYEDLKEVTESLPWEIRQYVQSLAPRSFVAVGIHTPSMEMLQDCFRTLCYLDEGDKDWKYLTDLPTKASTCMAGLAVLSNKLYIVGGVQGVSKQVVELCYCYDATANEWTTISSPSQLRYNFTLVGHKGKLYAIGGEFERAIMSSVEVYDIATDAWSFACHTPRPVADAACTKAMGRIFMCFWKPKDTTDIYEYIPGQDEWSLITTLIRPHSYGHCMVAHRDNLYVMRNGPYADFLRCLMDCYNITTGQWTAIPGHYINSKGALFTAVVRGNSAFTVNRMLTLEYAVGTGGWKPCREMKGFPRSGSVSTFLLRLPKTRIDPKQREAPDSSGQEEEDSNGLQTA